MPSTPETFRLLESRNISGRGLFILPDDKSVRHYWLFLNVVRLPSNNSLSSKFNPDKSDYAKITWNRDGYVLKDESLSYENQRFDWAVDRTGYLASYLVCAFKEITSYLDYLAPFIPAPPLVTDPTERLYCEPLHDYPDTIKIVCRANTAIVADLYYLKYDVRCPEAEPTPKDPPSPSFPPPHPPGEPFNNDPPYDGDNDNGDSIPYQGDTNEPPPPPPPGPVQCQRYNIALTYNIVNVLGQPAGTRTTNVEQWGIISNIRVVSNQFFASTGGDTNVACITPAADRLIFTDTAINVANPNLTYVVTPV